jgi:hypothetical protein
MVEGKDREETIRLTGEALGISKNLAAFIVAQELGEIDGDEIALDEDGREIRGLTESLPATESDKTTV